MSDIREAFMGLTEIRGINRTSLNKCDNCGNTSDIIRSFNGTDEICGRCGRKYIYPTHTYTQNDQPYITFLSIFDRADIKHYLEKYNYLGQKKLQILYDDIMRRINSSEFRSNPQRYFNLWNHNNTFPNDLSLEIMTTIRGGFHYD